MYNGRMWLVVKPTVGVPLFFAGVALTSLAVHATVFAKTTWATAFLEGGRRAARTSEAPAPQPNAQLAAVTFDQVVGKPLDSDVTVASAVLPSEAPKAPSVGK